MGNALSARNDRLGIGSILAVEYGTSDRQDGCTLAPFCLIRRRALTQRSSTMPDDSQDTPVLDTIAAMTAVSVAESNLPLDALLLVRLAALAAVDARPASYLLHIGPAAEAGITLEDAQNVLVAVAPIIGTARVMSAAINIAEALELAIAVIAEDLE